MINNLTTTIHKLYYINCGKHFTLKLNFVNTNDYGHHGYRIINDNFIHVKKKHQHKTNVSYYPFDNFPKRNTTISTFD